MWKFWNWNCNQWTACILGFIAFIVLCALIALILLLIGLLDANHFLDFIFFAIGLIGITSIGLVSCNRWESWPGTKAWIAVALIVAFAALPVIGINYNIKKGTIPLQKFSICHCEFCFQAEVEDRVGCICRNDLKNLIRENYVPSSWEKEYEKALAHIGKHKKGKLLELCCSDDFLTTLNGINKKIIEKKISPLIEKNLSKEDSSKLKQKISELLIFNSIGLSSYSETIEKCSSTNNCCQSCCNSKKCNEKYKQCPECGASSEQDAHKDPLEKMNVPILPIPK